MPQLNLDNIYTYHAPFGDQTVRYAVIRETAKSLAEYLQAFCPDSRERALAMTNLEQAVMWANASIARNEQPDDADATGGTLGAVS